jgi:hypothetical protein
LSGTRQRRKRALTEKADSADNAENREPSREVSTEAANESQGENEVKDHQGCQLRVRLDKKGNVKFVSMDENCLRIFEQLPPVRRQFWRRRLTPELRGKTEHAEESMESKDGRQTT